MGQCCSSCCNPNGRGELPPGEMRLMHKESNSARIQEISSQKVGAAPEDGQENEPGLNIRGNSKQTSMISGKQIDLNNEAKLNSHPSERNSDKKLSQASNKSQILNSEEQNNDNKGSFNVATTKIQILESRKVENSMPYHADLSQPRVDLVRAYRPYEVPEKIPFYMSENLPHYHHNEYDVCAKDLPL